MKDLTNNKRLTFEIEPFFEIEDKREKEVMEKIKATIENETKDKITKFSKLGVGQNINFKVFIEKSSEPKYLLRIISKKGYPSITTLRKCYDLLKNTGIRVPNILFFNDTKDIVPYGFFLQQWISGVNGLEKFDGDNFNMRWIRDFAMLLKKVHQVKVPYFGYLDDGPKYHSLTEYYDNLDKDIDASFGKVLKGDYSIWDLEKYNIVTPNFISKTFETIKILGDKIQTPVESVLLHGDMFPTNLIYTNNHLALIDWDETRANWWVYEIARTFFYIDSKDLIREFIKVYDDNRYSIEEIDYGIRIEHTRQLLRKLFMMGFKSDFKNIRKDILEIEEKINRKLNEKIL